MNIYLEGRISGWKLHSLYDSLIEFPPEGVTFNYTESEMPSQDGSALRSINAFFSDIQPLKGVIGHFKPFLYYAYYKATHRAGRTPKTDMIYSSQHLIFDPVPWVVDLEFVTGLVGYGSLRTYKRIVERTLASKYCKRIMPWTDAAKETLRLGLDCRDFDEKIETVHLAVPPKKFLKRFEDDNVRLLFVATGNKFNLRRSFELKGGREVLAAFADLRKRNPRVTLTIRSSVPTRYREFCLEEGIRVLPDVLTSEKLRQEFERADIFVFPGHQTPGSVILDAMSYELPVVATNIWGMSEMIIPEQNGFLTRPSRFAKYTDDKLVPLWGEPGFLKSIARVDQDMVRDIVEKVSYLVENPGERRRMGREGRKEIDIGKFSIVERNRKLLRIFKESMNS